MSKELVALSHMSEQERLSLSPFEKHFYNALHITPISSHATAEESDQYGKDITTLFPQSFFTEENEVTAGELLLQKLIRTWPEEVPLNQFQKGEECIKNFCTQSIPILQETYTDLDQDRIGHHLISATIIAYSKLREKYGVIPLSNNVRTRLHFSISAALESIDNPSEEMLDTSGREVPLFVRS